MDWKQIHVYVAIWLNLHTTLDSQLWIKNNMQIIILNRYFKLEDHLIYFKQAQLIYVNFLKYIQEQISAYNYTTSMVSGIKLYLNSQISYALPLYDNLTISFWMLAFTN